MNGWDILIGGAIALLLVLAFRTATSKKEMCIRDSFMGQGDGGQERASLPGLAAQPVGEHCGLIAQRFAALGLSLIHI